MGDNLPVSRSITYCTYRDFAIYCDKGSGDSAVESGGLAQLPGADSCEVGERGEGAPQ